METKEDIIRVLENGGDPNELYGVFFCFLVLIFEFFVILSFMHQLESTRNH